MSAKQLREKRLRAIVIELECKHVAYYETSFYRLTSARTQAIFGEIVSLWCNECEANCLRTNYLGTIKSDEIRDEITNRLAVSTDPPDELYLNWLYRFVKDPAKHKPDATTPVCRLMRFDRGGNPEIILYGTLGILTMSREQLLTLVLKRLADVKTLERNFPIDKRQLAEWLKMAK